MSRRPIAHVIIAFAVAASPGVWARQSRSVEPTAVDAVFARWTARTPGCAVGVAAEGRPLLERAYGMADLEHDAPNAPDTIFEAGSVSKQFTAAAVLLLARDGKLSLDDPVRKHVPELPEYGAPLTIRHMLSHTSGLRDWGNVAAIAGWPRTTRVHTHAHVLDIVSRQRALNFPPGTRWSYSNTGYNLAAVIVSRVSGQPFAEFTRERIFGPLGMTRTSWRDDHTRVVKGRAIAYSDEPDGFHIDMPFEKVHGNGGLLTTVGDLLRWNENFASPKVGSASFVAEQQQPGRFNDGRAHDYALGLRVGEYKGVREVSHGGATAGYRSYLARYPDQGVSVAVLCNVSSGNAGQYASAIAELHLKDQLTESRRSAAHTLSDAEIAAVQGLYRHAETGQPLTLVRQKEATNGLSIDRGPGLLALSPTRFVSATGGRTLDVDGSGRLRVTDPVGSVETYVRVAPAQPTPEKLRDYAGTYVSDEAEVTYTVSIDDGNTLVLRRRPDTVIRLSPVYEDAFRASIGLVRFRRGKDGRVAEFSVVQDRVWDLRFKRGQTPF
jgi:CubicO group peptidase (beta-lactamase class C family)